VPYTRPESDLRHAVDCLAAAWTAVTTRADGRPDRPHRVMVA
jgi:hypothetical protein